MARSHQESLTGIGQFLHNSFKDQIIRLSVVWNATLCVDLYISKGAIFYSSKEQRTQEFYLFEEIFLQKKKLIAWFSIWNTSIKQPTFLFTFSFTKVVQQHYHLLHLIVSKSNNNPQAWYSHSIVHAESFGFTVLLPLPDKILLSSVDLAEHLQPQPHILLNPRVGVLRSLQSPSADQPGSERACQGRQSQLRWLISVLITNLLSVCHL